MNKTTKQSGQRITEVTKVSLQTLDICSPDFFLKLDLYNVKTEDNNLIRCIISPEVRNCNRIPRIGMYIRFLKDKQYWEITNRYSR